MFRFHDLRHTIASPLGMAEGDLFMVGKLLRLRHTAITARYPDLSEGSRHKAVDILPDSETDRQKLIRSEETA
jgi:hypothetical protein